MESPRPLCGRARSVLAPIACCTWCHPAAGSVQKTAASVQAYFAEPRNRALIDKLRAAGVRLSKERAATAGPLAGLVLVATGRLEHYSRQQIEERIRQLGGIVADSVTKKTSYVIVGADAGSKADKAVRLGLPILSEQAFEALVAERSRPRTAAD